MSDVTTALFKEIARLNKELEEQQLQCNAVKSFVWECVNKMGEDSTREALGKFKNETINGGLYSRGADVEKYVEQLINEGVCEL